MKKKVLIIEDKAAYQSLFYDYLKAHFELIQAQTIEEARELLLANKNVDIIALDACVPGNHINTVPLLKEIKVWFQGPIIAISDYEPFQNNLVKEGCTHKAGKWELPDLLKNLFL